MGVAGRTTTPAGGTPWLEIASRVFLLLLCLAIVLIAVFGASPAATTGSSAPEAPPEAGEAHFSLPSPTNDMQEILATDPDAAPHDWQFIVIHHSASAQGSAQAFDRYHREVRHWRSLGYHFVIGNGAGQGDGLIIAGPRWYGQQDGAHANTALYNEHGIGICLVGNFEEHPPTPAQLAALRELVMQLCARYKIGPENIVGHNQVRHGGSTACPGRLFPMDELRGWVRSSNNGCGRDAHTTTEDGAGTRD